jgi:hypothetical protein
MAVTLHRCSNTWVKLSGHPCWKVQKALDDMGIEYVVDKGPLMRSNRGEMEDHTGQRLYPAIEFENGTWYREGSKEMEATIRSGNLLEKSGQATEPPASG